MSEPPYDELPYGVWGAKRDFSGHLIYRPEYPLGEMTLGAVEEALLGSGPKLELIYQRYFQTHVARSQLVITLLLQGPAFGKARGVAHRMGTETAAGVYALELPEDATAAVRKRSQWWLGRCGEGLHTDIDSLSHMAEHYANTPQPWMEIEVVEWAKKSPLIIVHDVEEAVVEYVHDACRHVEGRRDLYVGGVAMELGVEIEAVWRAALVADERRRKNGGRWGLTLAAHPIIDDTESEWEFASLGWAGGW